MCISTTGFSSKTDYFTISSSSSPATPLPIELLYFNAQCETSNTKLIWATASETNNDYFSVEKSHDGSTFENIGNVAGAGFSNTLLPYSLIDDNPYSDITYYRLKQTDFNGNFTYSDIISSSCGYEAHISMIVSQTENGIYLSINPGNSKILH